MFFNEGINNFQHDLTISTLKGLGRAGGSDLTRMREHVLEDRSRLRHSGTTIVAFGYDDGVVMAADRQTSDGWEKTSETVKIRKINEFSLFGAAGLVTYIQDIFDVLLRTMDGFSQFLEGPIYIKGQARILEHTLKENFLALGVMTQLLGYVAVPILAGVDPEQHKVYLFSYDDAGAVYEHMGNVRRFATVGSGSLYAKGVLEQLWSVELNEERALRLAVEAVYRAGISDMGSSPAELYPPTVQLITLDGIKEIPYKVTRKIAWDLFHKDLVRMGDEERLSFFKPMFNEGGES